MLSRNDVVFALDRAGLVGDDGPTHHGVFDLVYARMMPGMRVFAPADEAELVHGLHTALALGGPFCLRYPRGAAEGVPLPDSPEVLEPGVARRLREGEDVAILALGRMAGHALAAADILAESGIEARVVDLRWAKPLDRKAIKNAAKTKLVVTVEEGVVTGGVGEGILEILSEMGEATPTLVHGHSGPFCRTGQSGPALQGNRARCRRHRTPHQAKAPIASEKPPVMSEAFQFGANCALCRRCQGVESFGRQRWAVDCDGR